MTDRKTDLVRLKAGLLCYGARVERETAILLEREYPHFFDKGFVHAVNIHLYDANINISVAEEFSSESPYLLQRRDDGYYVTGEGMEERITFFESLPYTGTILDDLARLHSEGCINVWPSTNCCYDAPEIKCRFCSLQAETREPLEIKSLCADLKKLLALVPEDYMLNFSGGTYQSPDRMLRYWIDLAREIRTFSNVDITVEFAPPEDLGLLKELKEAGVGVAIMNLEIADPVLRKKICPGKSKITYEHYHEAFREAVRIFGHGMVSSVLIGGIQPKEDILKECERMAAVGVYPTIMPFRPMDNCELYGFRRCEPEELIEMSDALAEMIMRNGLDYRKQPGCTKCGGCSLENDCVNRKVRAAALHSNRNK